MRTLLLPILAMFLVPTEARSEEILSPGARVRITAPSAGKPSKGRLVSFDDQALIVVFDGGAAPSRIPREAVERIQVAKRSRALGVLRGAGIGAAAGFAGGALGARIFSDEPEGAGVAAFIYGSLGTVVGAAVGAALPVQRWQDTDAHKLRLGLAPRPDGLGASLSVSF